MAEPTFIPVPRASWPLGGSAEAHRLVAAETPVAIVHDGSTHAVMMATPHDLEDFAIGFSFSEGVISRLDDVTQIEVVDQTGGIEVRTWLTAGPGARLATRRRRLAGPTGCGLCGVESLEAAVSTPPPVSQDFVCGPADLLAAMNDLAQSQALGRKTRAAHAAGFWRDGTLVALREDVGRHNALDKLVGHLLRARVPPAGIVLLTSRVSVEMVQKTAAFGAPILCAVSAPTSLAIQVADAAGVTLVAVCRADGFEVFTHPRRINLLP